MFDVVVWFDIICNGSGEGRQGGERDRREETDRQTRGDRDRHTERDTQRDGCRHTTLGKQAGGPGRAPVGAVG